MCLSVVLRGGRAIHVEDPGLSGDVESSYVNRAMGIEPVNVVLLALVVAAGYE